MLMFGIEHQIDMIINFIIINNTLINNYDLKISNMES